MDELKYKFGDWHAKPMVLETDDKQFQGIVLLYEGEEREHDRFLVPVTSGTYSEALDEANALAHRIIAAHADEERRKRY